MKYLTSVLIVFLLGACSILPNSRMVEDTVLVEMTKLAGRSINPEYVMKIMSNGMLYYDGVKNVKEVGEMSRQLTNGELKSITKLFTNANFFSLNDEYTARVSDLPTTLLKYTSNDNTKTIRDYYGAPEKLKNLEGSLESYVQDWIK